uniref:C-myc promoter-binding protein isoform X3 n=1 Tax=Ciona intestinalis TaxID=7719 RepID=UPI00089DBCD3|nr:C-myc promoter-binding protein isoform X3 [Ciona intestinalis]|eukprot:XP_018671970.1 C-myc promoter-binding protein isoform X3 [Ciona intestinalis]
MGDYEKIAEYFVIAGLTESSLPLDEDLAFPNAQHKLSDQRKDPITDICVIDRTLEETCPQDFTCIELTPTGFPADLNHGSLTAHNIFLCYRRGKDKPPLIDLGVYYEGLETVRSGISILETTPAGRSGNVNNKSGMGSHPIYLTYRRAKETAPQNALAVTDICIILSNKAEKAPYAFCQIEKNLNKGIIGSNVFLCYKKSMRQVDSIAFKAGFIGRYPADDSASFLLPDSVPLFCLPMGATIECWSSKTRHPLPTFSSFVLTTETSDKVFGAVVSFYESYPEEKLTDDQKYKLGILRGDGQRSKTPRTIHTNKAICLLSRWPMFSAFRDFLMYLYRMTVSPIAHQVPVERHIAHFMHNVPFPTSQRPRVQYQMSPMHTTIITRPQITPIPLSGASFLALLDDLGPENTLTLLVLALTEHKIVIHSLRPAEITCVAEALITLLFPFKWQCTYVPLCPLEMGYVMEAPCPFIVGVDSRYFDIYEPPSDVACVNLDTNSITMMEEKKSISWKLLPKKPAKLLKSTLQKYFKEVKECPREDSNGGTMMSLQDPDISRTERHRKIDLAIQEAVLKLTTSMMKGYRQFLLPITEAPNSGTTDPSSLFNIQEFVRSRERSSQRFFNSLVGTQLFSSFIEERCLTSSTGMSDGISGRSGSLVFFDECIDRLTPDHDHVHLIETDSQISDHTVMIMPPDEKGLPPGVGYQYTTFPDLTDELFILNDEDAGMNNDGSTRSRRKSETFTFGHRTKQELRTMQKLSKFHSGDPQLWARLLMSHTYGAWFACLPAFVIECRHKSAALRTAHDALHSLKDKNCIPLPDETYYRMLLHLCSVYNKPALAVRVFQFVRKTGIQLSAITYGLYNKAVLEGTWPSSNRDGYMLWLKLRNVFLATRKFRYGLRRYSKMAGSDASSDLDSTSHASVESNHTMSHPPPVPDVRVEEPDHPPQKTQEVRLQSITNEEDCKSTAYLGGQSDHGYNSMPKEQIRRGSPHKGLKVTQSVKATLTEEQPQIQDQKPPVSPSISLHNSNNMGRSVKPPNTLDIPGPHGDRIIEQHTDPGLRSDETLVNGEAGDPMAVLHMGNKSASGEVIGHRPRSIPVSPALHRKPGHSSFMFKSIGSTGSTGGASGDSNTACQDKQPTNNPNENLSSNKTNVMHGSNGSKSTECSVQLTTNQLSPINNQSNKGLPLTPGLSGQVADDVFEGKETSDEDVHKTQVSKTSPKLVNGAAKTPGASPATPELTNLFGGDAKFLSSLSDSDQLRYQELCSHRSPSINESSDLPRSPRYASLSTSRTSRGRASTSLFPGGSNAGGISPLIGQKFLLENKQFAANRSNFDNLTADDIMSPGNSPSHTGKTSSILARKNRSPSRLIASSPSPRKRSQTTRVIGSNSLVVVDGVAMLTSTPLRPVVETTAPTDPLSATDSSNAGNPTSLTRKTSAPNLNKQRVERQDISHLATDPLSPYSKGTSPEVVESVPVPGISMSRSTNSLSRHLVDEIEDYLKRDELVRCSSDATLIAHQMERVEKIKNEINALPEVLNEDGESSPNTQRKNENMGLVRSNTFHNDQSTPSNTWFSSGSKFNSLLKATTVGMATKAKKVASNLAKDLNETMQASLAYYTPEKIKGSLTDLTGNSQEDIRPSNEEPSAKRNLEAKGFDLYSSQSSLRSSDSLHSAIDSKPGDRVKRRPGGKHRPQKLERPLSMPQFDSGSGNIPPLASSYLSIPGVNSTDPNITSSMTSLNNKGTSDVEVTISSCSKCHKCGSLVYDEEIMAGWIADESSLNTHCPFCNSLFVPFLNIEIKDFRQSESNKFHASNFLSTSHEKISDSTNKTTESLSPVAEGYAGSFVLPLTPDATIQSPDLQQNQAADKSCVEQSEQKPQLMPTPPNTPLLIDIGTTDTQTTPTTPTNSNFNSLPKDLNPTPSSSDNPPHSPLSNKSSATEESHSAGMSLGDSQSELNGPSVSQILEPVTVPYLSSLVLRKELENLLENEGTKVLLEPGFVDHHPIIYWNLVWCFRRLNLHSNLYKILLRSQLLQQNSKVPPNKKDNVVIHLMWDNLKLHLDGDKPPLYCAWHQIMTNGPSEEYQSYSQSFLSDIKESIMQDDVLGPLVAVLNELNVQRGIRRSAYREILYFIIVALGKASIDTIAFDREYRRAFELLSPAERALTHKCDRPPNDHAIDCREIFGELDLYK